jgi:hypothetical protein
MPHLHFVEFLRISALLTIDLAVGLDDQFDRLAEILTRLVERRSLRIGAFGDLFE